MSSFEVLAYTVSIEPHPNADAIEIAKIDGTEYISIVSKKDNFKTGDIAIYIPEQALLPDFILQEMGLWDEKLGKGTLAGHDGNRVKPIRLRGVFSQGLVYRPADKNHKLQLNHDYALELGITKWTPPIPIFMSGKAAPAPDIVSYTDIENVKKFPQVMQKGEMVIASEKVHGTNVVFRLDGLGFHVSSKGLSSRHLELIEEMSDSELHKNVYWRIAKQLDIPTKLLKLKKLLQEPYALSLFGEIYGDGIQDLKYGLKNSLNFIAFDIMIEDESKHYTYLDFAQTCYLVKKIELDFVPILYHGPYDWDTLTTIASGSEQISGKELHLREGIVVKPVHERQDPKIGRAVLKFISPAYLLRKGNSTEFE